MGCLDALGEEAGVGEVCAVVVDGNFESEGGALKGDGLPDVSGADDE